MSLSVYIELAVLAAINTVLAWRLAKLSASAAQTRRELDETRATLLALEARLVSLGARLAILTGQADAPETRRSSPFVN